MIDAVEWSGPILAQWFVRPLSLNGAQQFYMLLPLVFAVAVVYKTIHCRRLRDIPVAAVVLWITILCGMFGIGIGLYAVYSLLA